MKPYQTQVQKALGPVLLVVALVILLNMTVIGILNIWLLVNIVVILIAVVYTLFGMEHTTRSILRAILLWIPALLVLFMGSQGLFLVSVAEWNVINLIIIFIYTYLAGMRLCEK